MALGGLFVADLVTGVWASRKRGQPITSDRFGRTVSTSIVYLLSIIIAHVAEQYVFGATVPVLKVVAGIMGTTEFLSFAENAEAITSVPFRRYG